MPTRTYAAGPGTKRKRIDSDFSTKLSAQPCLIFCPTMPTFLPNPTLPELCDVDGWATTLKTTPATTRGLRGADAAPTRNSYLYMQEYVYVYFYIYIYIYICTSQQPTRTYADLLRRLAYADPTQTYAMQATCYPADFQCSRLYVALLVARKAAQMKQPSIVSFRRVAS